MRLVEGPASPEEIFLAWLLSLPDRVEASVSIREQLEFVGITCDFYVGGAIGGSRRMWTNNNRGRYDRSKLRYPSDMTDDEWGLIRPLIPPAKRGGNKRTVDEREVVNGLMYILSTGCQWASLPKDLPPRSTVNDYFCRWNHDGTLDRVHHALYVQCRELAGQDASPTAAIIDSQSVKSAEKGGLRSTRRALMRERRSKARSAMSW